MQVTVKWNRTEYYVQTVEVDEDAVRFWLADEDASKVDPLHEVTVEEVKEFFEAGDLDEVGLEAVATNWVDADGPQIEEVEA